MLFNVNNAGIAHWESLLGGNFGKLFDSFRVFGKIKFCKFQ